MLAMICGGLTTTILVLTELDLPLGLNANIFGIGCSMLVYIAVAALGRSKYTARCKNIS
jgi:hypothetical protein